jgi:hypothetical protein
MPGPVIMARFMVSPADQERQPDKRAKMTE